MQTEEYFYTLELSEADGKRLERMAAEASYDDVEAFAALILRNGMDAMERERAEARRRALSEPPPGADGEDLPF